MLALAQAHYRAAWFVFGSIEREHRLNLDALAASWPLAPIRYPDALSFDSALRPAPRAAAS